MDKDDEYVKQLEEIFNSFCSDSTLLLNSYQLLKLCDGLSLNDGCSTRLCQLAFPNSLSDKESTIDFEKFCDCFVAALSDVSDETTHEISDEHSEDVPPCEVKPRLVRGGKAYGRRSLPVDVLDKEPSPKSDESLPASVSAPEFSNKNVVDIYYEPIRDQSTRNDDYFEASGSAEVHPQQNGVEAKLRREMSSSMILDGMGDASMISITGGGGVDLFSSLNHDGSSLVEIGQLVEFWRQGSITEYQPIFEALNIDHSNFAAVVDSFELSSALEREVMTSSLATLAAPHHAVTSALIHSLKYHLLQTDDKLHRYRHQVEKMKEDLDRSELRNSKIMEEVDDRYVSLDQQHELRIEGMERKWSKKLQCSQRNFDRERESILAQAAQEREELLREMDALRSSENILRRKVDVLTAENNSSSEQAVLMLERLQEAEKDADRLRNDLECLLAAKASDDRDAVNTSQEEKFAMIIKDYEAQCRQAFQLLSDRNDELSSEIREVRSQLRLQETRYNEKSFNKEQKRSPMRKKTRRRQRSDGSVEDTDSSEDNLSELERRHQSQYLGSNTGDSLAYNFASVRMGELEQLVENLRREKRKAAENFAFEKAELRASIEAEFRAKDRSCDDNRAVEEQRTMTVRLLEEAIRERDEFESKYKNLKESMERETSSGEKKMTDLCREFANEKNELVAKHEAEVASIGENLNSTNLKLKEEKQTNLRLTDQLKFERSQHKEALAAHQEIINKFEKSTAAAKENSGEKFREIQEQHQEELRQVMRDHAAEIEAVKRDMAEKLDALLSERQSFDGSSMCSELERLQESIVAERREMHERLQEMRESFEREAVELRQMLDKDKTKLRQQLNEEVALIRQRIAEEGQRAMERKKEEMEEELKRKAESVKAEQKEKAELIGLRSEINAIHTRNLGLERSLSEATSAFREQEERMKAMQETKHNQDSLLRRIEETKEKLLEKELDNSSLRKQLDDVLNENKDNKMTTSLLRMRSDEKTAENSQLLNENRELVEKVHHLDDKCKRLQMENVGLGAKCEALERTPTPKKRYDKEKVEMQEQERKEMQKQIKSLNAEIADIRSQQAMLGRDVTPHSDDVCDDVTLDPDAAQEKGEQMSFMRRRLTQTRKQLTEHMEKMKDLYGKLSKSELLVKDLYCENAHLMRALQVTEARQKSAEQRCEEEINKTKALGQLVKRICNEVV